MLRFMWSLLAGCAVTLAACGPAPALSVPDASVAPESATVAEPTVAEPATAEPAIMEPASTAADNDAPEATAEVASALAALAPTATPAPENSAAPAALPDWTTTATLEGDYVILGNPAAPIRLVDYSDFM